MADEPTGASEGEHQSAGSSQGSPPQPNHSGAPGGTDWEARARQEQGRADRLAAQIRELESRVAAPAPEAQNYSFDLNDIPKMVRSEMVRGQALANELASLRTTYGDVADLRPDLFDVTAFDSPEAMRVAVETFNDQLQGVLQKKGVGEANNSGPGTPNAPPSAPVDGGQQTAGLPTAEEIAGWSFDQIERFEAAHPGLIEKIAVDAMTGAAA